MLDTIHDTIAWQLAHGFGYGCIKRDHDQMWEYDRYRWIKGGHYFQVEICDGIIQVRFGGWSWRADDPWSYQCEYAMKIELSNPEIFEKILQYIRYWTNVRG